MRKVSRELAISMILQVIVVNLQRNSGTGKGIEALCNRLEKGFTGYQSYSDSELESEYDYLTNKIDPFKIEKPSFQLERDITQVNRYMFTVHADTIDQASDILDQCLEAGEMPCLYQHTDDGVISCYDRIADC